MTAPDPYAPLKIPEIRALLFAVASSVLASSALGAVIGYQVYQLAKDPLALGLLGLIEAIPALGLALIGGFVADRFERRGIVLMTTLVMVLASLGFALFANSSLWSMYTIVFVIGVARGFSSPALAALEAQVVPPHLTVVASSWLSASWIGCGIAGPALGGFAFDAYGSSTTFFIIAGLYSIALFGIFLIAKKPKPVPPKGERMLESIAVGVRFVAKNQILLGSMALDLFAVLFGGAMALLPIFADEILNVGASGFGFLVAAPSLGALSMMLFAAHYPPQKNAGRNLMLGVAGFGCTMIVFALSTNYYLSLFILMLSGVFDGYSMVIRKSIVRLESPEHMRGRISSVSGIFIGASNELGALESGVAAKLFGASRSVWMGGIVTLLVVAATAFYAPKLRTLDLEPQIDKRV